MSKLGLKEHYETLHPMPNTDRERIMSLVYLYNEFSVANGGFRLSKLEEEGLAEYYRLFKDKYEDYYYVLVESIYKLRKKSKEKISFAYYIGMLKNWLNYGFGRSGRSLEWEIEELILELSGLSSLSPKAREVLDNLYAVYGPVKLTRVVTEQLDYSLAVMKELQAVMGILYEREGFAGSEINVHNGRELEESRKKERPSSEDVEKRCRDIYRYIGSNKGSSVTRADIIKFLNSKKLSTDKSSVSRYMRQTMKLYPNVVKVGRGTYTVK